MLLDIILVALGLATKHTFCSLDHYGVLASLSTHLRYIMLGATLTIRSPLLQYLLLSVTDPAARFKPVGVSDVSIYVFIATSLILRFLLSPEKRQQLKCILKLSIL